MSVSASPPPRATLDLRGEVCPYTFVRTKLALEELPPGAELDILLDHPAAYRSVPRALRDEGHEVLSVSPSPDQSSCAVLCRRGPA